MTFRIKMATGIASNTDAELLSARKAFTEMTRDLEVLGAGLCEHLQLLRSYYENAEKLSSVLSEYFGSGPMDRSSEWIEAGGSELAIRNRDDGLIEATKTSMERWAYLNAVARRSATALIVELALDPLRKLAGEGVASVRKAISDSESSRIDYEQARTSKKATREQIDETRVRFEASRAAALNAIEASLSTFDCLVVDAACTLAACHTELLAATAELTDEAVAQLPPDVAAIFREQMRDMVKVGGPEIVKKDRSKARTAWELLTGKKQLEDYRSEREDVELKRRLQQEQFKRVVQERQPPSASPPESGQQSVLGGSEPTQPICPAKQRESDAYPPRNKTVTAAYDCVGERPGELSFAKGDSILVIDDSDPSWWKGQLLQSSRQVGLFPSNYVASASHAHPENCIKNNDPPHDLPAGELENKPLFADALYDCQSEDSAELAFKAGDRLRILSQSGDWWLAERYDGARGIAPSNYLKLVTD